MQVSNPYVPIVEGILQALQNFLGSEGGGVLNSIVADAQHLLRFGEPRVAFENLCENLFEEGVQITPEIYGQIEAAGEAMGVSSGRYEFLRKLISGGGGDRET